MLLWALSMTPPRSVHIPTPTAPAPVSRSLKGFMSAADLEAHCSADPNAKDGLHDVCLGYLAGATDQILAPLGLPNVRIMCAPDDLTLGAVRDAFLGYLKSHPDARTSSAASILPVVLIDAFPCSGFAVKP